MVISSNIDKIVTEIGTQFCIIRSIYEIVCTSDKILTGARQQNRKMFNYIAHYPAEKDVGVPMKLVLGIFTRDSYALTVSTLLFQARSKNFSNLVGPQSPTEKHCFKMTKRMTKKRLKKENDRLRPRLLCGGKFKPHKGESSNQCIVNAPINLSTLLHYF